MYNNYQLVVVGVDPSGEFDKGKGTTGVAVVGVTSDGLAELLDHHVVFAKDYKTKLQYWDGVLTDIHATAQQYDTPYVVIEDYILYASSAKAQINSEMETSKLIGVLVYHLRFNEDYNVMLNIAANVKKRWFNLVLEHEQVVTIEHVGKGQRMYDVNHKPINPHAVDAIRHAMHGAFFLVKKGKFES